MQSYYADPRVSNELREFLNNRRIYVVCKDRTAEISMHEIELYSDCSIYGSIELISEARATPSISVRFRQGFRRLAFETVKLIISYLRSLGVEESFYVVWTGSWFEVRIHERAIPLEYFESVGDIVRGAIGIANYVVKRMSSKLTKISFITNSGVWIEVINDKLIAPLSRIDSNVAVYLKGELLDNFDPQYSSLTNPVHVNLWNRYIENEASDLVREVLKAIESRSIDLDKPIVIRAPIRQSMVLPKVVGRFEVMALLQAIRYYLLTGDLDKAKSFGLNRAIFYAWAKYYGPRRTRVSTLYISDKATKDESERHVRSELQVLNDVVEVSPRGYFSIGGQEQTPQDFDRQVKLKFENLIPFEIVWNIALDYVKKFPEGVLKDPNKFFKYVYEPVRDNFIERIVLTSDFDTLRKEHLEAVKRSSTNKQHKAMKPPIKSLFEFVRRDSELEPRS